MAKDIYKINNSDVFTSFGLAVERFIDDLLRFPESKEVFSQSWGDQNGTEYYLDERFFKDKTAILKGCLIASNLDVFKAKRKALENTLTAPGELLIEAIKFGVTFKGFYLKNNVAELLTNLTTGGVAMKLELEFQITGIVNNDISLMVIDGVPVTVDGLKIYIR